MTDTMLDASATEDLRPIRVGFFETLRLVRKSYVYPLEHAQELQARFGNAVMQKMAAADYGVDYQKHEGIASALKSRDPEKARQAIRSHIENSYGGILNQTEGPEE